MSFNLAKISGGPAIILYRGATLFTKDGVKLDASLDTFNVSVDGISAKADERVTQMPIKITATPDGAWGNLAVLFPYFAAPIGSFTTPRMPIGAINTSNSHITVTAHGLSTADAVFAATRGTLPTATPALSAATQYFVNVIDANTFTLHSTAADATGNANTITFSNGGTGDQFIVINYPLTIQTFDGQYAMTFYNVSLSKHADLEFSRNKTLFSSAFEFTAYIKQGAAISDANSYYTITASSPMTSVFEWVNNIPTQPYTLSWGSSAPWSSFDSKAGIKVQFPLTLTAVEDDAFGVISHRVTDVQASATLVAMGMSAGDILSALQIQGSGAALGRSLGASGNNLDITGTNVFCRLYGAALKKGPQAWNSKDERSGELNFIATKTIVSNVVQPIALVGTAAP
ncbi:MAG: hypothetical protein WCD79_17920 [Chthoniobacteraceae bacterium]